MTEHGYIIKNKSRRTMFGKNFRTRQIAEDTIKNTIKNNPLKKRQQVGAIGMKVVQVRLYEREIEEFKNKNKDFVWL